jgi:hypothetical protein
MSSECASETRYGSILLAYLPTLYKDSRLLLPRIEEIHRHMENPVLIFIAPRYIPPLFGEASDGIDPLR